jgi:hypothetical protein
VLKGFRFIGSLRVGVHKLDALAEREIFHGRSIPTNANIFIWRQVY